MKPASERKNNYFKNMKVKPDLLLQGTSTTRKRTEEFSRFWKGIVQKSRHPQPAEFLKGEKDTADIYLQIYWGEADEIFTTTHVELSTLLSRVPLGKDGGQDGVFWVSLSEHLMLITKHFSGTAK